MTPPPLVDALMRAERLLFESPVLESFIARREAGETDAGDRETAGALADELIAHQSGDGSWGNSLVHTSEALLLLADLRPFDHDVDAAIARSLGWLRCRQGKEGAFTDGCTPERHALSLCAHFAGGFFSPGPPSVSFADMRLSSGATFPTDDDARLGASAIALRACLRYQEPTIDDRLQIDALLRVADLLFRAQSRVATPAAVAVLGTLARAPRTAVQLAVLHAALSRLAGSQRADGSWPGAEGFHVADALLYAVQSGYGSPLFDNAILRTAEVLVLSQHADGSWGQDAGSHRLLIGWRTLRYAAGMRSAYNRTS